MGAAEVIVSILGLVAGLLDGIGKVAAGKKVREIITSEFPEFPDRARAAGEKARDVLGGKADPATP